MSLILRRSIPAAARIGARRRVLANNQPAAATVARSFWPRGYRSATETRARILGTSPWDQRNRSEEQEEEGSCSRQQCGQENFRWNIDTSMARDSSIPARRAAHERVHFRCNNGRSFYPVLAATNNAIFVPPPASIRSVSALHQLVAINRASTGNALRDLTTWACQQGLNRLTAQSHNHHQNNCLLKEKSLQIAFFVTNSDGSRLRDPDIAKGGIGKVKIPTPHSGPAQQSMKPEDVINEINKKSKTVVLPALVSGFKTVLKFLLNLPMNLFYYLTHPSEVKEGWNNMKKVIKDEIDHYWVGTKLLWADLKTARALLRRTLRGSSLTRRERKQLLRTISDLFRLIPFSMFLIIPLMEFALPFALKIFPNLLPSTFQDSLKAEENMKRELQTRIAMAKFFQETLEELAKEQKHAAMHLKEEIQETGEEGDLNESVVVQQEQSAASFLDFMEKARSGEIIPNDVIVRYAHYFRDDLTLDNMPRMQLINMCKYMGITPYGSDSFLRFQLRHRMRSLRDDDQRILWEGIDSLTKMELREACQERGMRSTGLSKDAYKRALQQWLDLSVKQNVPTSLLIMSRTFFLREEMFEPETADGSKSLAGLADAISGLDKEVVNEVILDVATSQEKMSDPGVRKIKLEVLMKQNELIEQEQAERDEAAAKKKEQAEKVKLDAEKETNPVAAEGTAFPTGTNPPEDFTLETTEVSGVESQAEPQSPAAQKSSGKEANADEELSSEEMDAISHLVSADPVSRERADLESIKAALQEEKSEAPSESGEVETHAIEFISAEETGNMAALHAQQAVEDKALSIKKLSTEEKVEDGAESVDEEPKETFSEDPVVSRLKRRIESMVDKIEVQLSDVQVKIGDKLHVLDKDMDGILSVDEIAGALTQVLKRKITAEEAMEIAKKMDDNKDGVCTVQELIQWVETNQLVRFVEEGRDADMDSIIEKQSAAESAGDANFEENSTGVEQKQSFDKP